MGLRTVLEKCQIDACPSDVAYTYRDVMSGPPHSALNTESVGVPLPLLHIQSTKHLMKIDEHAIKASTTSRVRLDFHQV